MANENGGECTYQWQIGNASLCKWLKKGKPINSPTFVVNGREQTKWSLRLYPMGYYESSMSVFLQREKDCIGPEKVEVEYELEFLDKDGVTSADEMEKECFRKGGESTSKESEDLESVFITDRETFLPGDTLTVQCQFRNLKKDGGREGLAKSQYLYARTVFNTRRKLFHCIFGKFSTLPPGVIWKYENYLMKISLILYENSGENLRVNILYQDPVKYIWGKISITDSEGKKETCKMFTDDDSTKPILADIPTKFIENKNRYLPNDELSLEFEIALSTIEHLETMDYSTKNSEQKKYEGVAALINDLKSLYNEHILSDVELRTSTKSFPANKDILSARSTVFRRMFSSDMKEKYSGHVDIDDLDDETIQRMLLFMYTGFLGELQFESVGKLLNAADKYEIQSLMILCFYFLEENLSPTTACKVLLLAELHQNVDLRKVVLDYIIKHDEVFETQEWKHLMDANIKLAADVMYKKLNPGFHAI